MTGATADRRVAPCKENRFSRNDGEFRWPAGSDGRWWAGVTVAVRSVDPLVLQSCPETGRPPDEVSSRAAGVGPSCMRGRRSG